MKTCYRCKEKKARSEYWNKTDSSDGLNSWCKDCTNEYKRERRANGIGKPTPERKPTLGTVYFIRESGKGYVKVGVTANDLATRMASMQCDNPHDLEVLASFYTDKVYDAEWRLHKRLHDHKVRGEWFDIDDETVDRMVALFASWRLVKA